MALGEALLSLKSDPQVTIEEVTGGNLTALKADIDDCRPHSLEECRQALQEAKDKATDEASLRIDELLVLLENPSTSYSIEALANNLEDQKARDLMRLYNALIASDFKDIYSASFENLSPTGQETIKIVIWGIIQSKISVKGVANTIASRATSMLEGFTSIFSTGDSDTPGNILEAQLKETTSRLEGVPGIDQEAVSNAKEVAELLSSVVGKEIDTLAQVFKLSEDKLGNDQKARKQIFENPVILNSLLKNGKYNKDDFKIDINEGIMEVGVTDDLEQVQTEFLQEVQDGSGKLGGAINKMQNIGEKFPFLKNFVMQFAETSVIGVFIKAIFGGMFSEFNGMLDAVDFESALKAVTNPKQRKSVRNLTSFLGEYAQDNTKENSPLSLFAIGGLSDDFVSKSQPFFETLKGADIDSSRSNFWETVLIGSESSPELGQIHEQMSEVLELGGLNEEVFVQALNNVTITPVDPTIAEPDVPNNTIEEDPEISD